LTGIFLRYTHRGFRREAGLWDYRKFSTDNWRLGTIP